MARRLLLTLTVLLWGSCVCDPLPVDTRSYACSVDDQCGPGFRCANGTCVRDGAGGTGGGSGGGSGGGAVGGSGGGGAGGSGGGGGTGGSGGGVAGGTGGTGGTGGGSGGSGGGTGGGSGGGASSGFTVNVSVVGQGHVTSVPAGINCWPDGGPGCSGLLISPAVLQGVGLKPGTVATSWSGVPSITCPAVDPPFCSFAGTTGQQVDVTVTFTHLNVAFVSAATTAGGAFGSNAGANLACQNYAADAGLDNPASFVAAVTTVAANDPFAQLVTYGPWLRVDNRPFAGDAGRMSNPWYPMRLDEHGVDFVDFPEPAAWVGFGGPSINCTNWSTSDAGTTGFVLHSLFSGISAWTQGYSDFCNTQNHLLCFERTTKISDGRAVVPRAPPGARLAFLSSDPWTAPLGPPDSHCQRLASDAGLPGTYLAFLRTQADGGDPSTRFTAAADWYLPDGVLLLPTSELGPGPRAFSFPVIDEKGAVHSTFSDWVWTGAAGATCADWTSNSPSVNGTPGLAEYSTSMAFNFGLLSCDRALPVYCFQQ